MRIKTFLDTALSRCQCRTRETSGFSLVEMLVATLVLVLVTAMVTTGVTTAINVRRQELFASQSQVIADSLNNAISVPFRFMIYDSEDGRYVIEYNGEKIYWNAEGVSDDVLPFLSVNEEQGVFVFRGDDKDGNPIERPLLNEKSYDTCRVSMQNVEVNHAEGHEVDTSLVTGVAGVYKVIDKTDESRSKTFSFCFHPLGKDYKLVTAD